ncbi:hypothetical protein SPI02_14440 [Staphylococcus piscifermentans]|uniref:Uncharacterized protein n=1 Tax=Staphylococcus piscifermentans TaxID=70258 RepID=A0A512QN33_9STAP|nr:hypothetical protein SPI02_14440 [Staphylococcus piscifermentans]
MHIPQFYTFSNCRNFSKKYFIHFLENIFIMAAVNRQNAWINKLPSNIRMIINAYCIEYTRLQNKKRAESTG